MKRNKLLVLLLNGVLLLAIFHYVMAKKETLLLKGKLVLLELAPVDPRSLMQGDYMELRYAIGDSLDTRSIPRQGYCVVRLDAGLIARALRVQPQTTPLQTGEYLIKYNYPGWRMEIGAESYFFQEGKADNYALAKYGGLRVDEQGNSLLVGLYDQHRQLIP